jgi:hypothetical protein
MNGQGISQVNEEMVNENELNFNRDPETRAKQIL